MTTTTKIQHFNNGNAKVRTYWFFPFHHFQPLIPIFFRQRLQSDWLGSEKTRKHTKKMPNRYLFPSWGLLSVSDIINFPFHWSRMCLSLLLLGEEKIIASWLIPSFSNLKRDKRSTDTETILHTSFLKNFAVLTICYYKVV